MNHNLTLHFLVERFRHAPTGRVLFRQKQTRVRRLSFWRVSHGYDNKIINNQKELTLNTWTWKWQVFAAASLKLPVTNHGRVFMTCLNRQLHLLFCLHIRVGIIPLWLMSVYAQLGYFLLLLTAVWPYGERVVSVVALQQQGHRFDPLYYSITCSTSVWRLHVN